jgi:PhoH-like ATPase
VPTSASARTRTAEAPEQTALDLHDGSEPQAGGRRTAIAQRCGVAVAPAPARPASLRRPAASSRSAPAPQAAPRGPPKLFVLDTNVLMHDPMSLFRFEEHDVFLPMITLEELDGHKKGMSEVARNVRQVSRDLDALAGASSFTDKDGTLDPRIGIDLAKTGHREAGGKLFFQTTLLDVKLPAGLPQGKADNQILGVVQSLREQHPGREVVLVSKDINMRVKARALGLPAEDYFNDKTLEDGDLLYTGVLPLPADFWERHGKTMESWQQGGHTFYRISGPLVPVLLINQFVYLEVPRRGASVRPRHRDHRQDRGAEDAARLHPRQERRVGRDGAQPRAELRAEPADGPGVRLHHAHRHRRHRQDADDAGRRPGQVLDDRRYTEIIVTRVTVPVGEDIGFLPGNEEEKMGPWMGALDDNLEVLARTDTSAGEWGRAATNDLVRSKIKIKSLNFMRGRTFLNKFVLIDEAQNLTPKQMKTLITRAGPGTKIVCLGNLAQIDTPYLTEGSSGLTYAVDRFKGWPHGGHVMLARGERSRLADFASEVL